MLMLSAPARTPRLALLRRLIVFGLLGALHMQLQPGEALLPYAIADLVLLLPVSFLPSKRWAQIFIASVGTLLLLGATWTGGGLSQVPGLFLLGYVAGITGLPHRIATSPRTSLWAAPLTVTSILGTIAAFVVGPAWIRTDFSGPEGGAPRPPVGLVDAVAALPGPGCVRAPLPHGDLVGHRNRSCPSAVGDAGAAVSAASGAGFIR